jgi:DNA invertase Pin-like site-specific DNA recombinase
MPLIGYARVSTEEQDLAPQRDALRAAGYAELFEEHASGASKVRRPVGARQSATTPGETQTVMSPQRASAWS